jgi:hypothetical protein
MRSKNQIIFFLFALILGFSFLFCSLIQIAHAKSSKLNITIPKSTDPILINGMDYSIISSWIAPQTKPAVTHKDFWKFENRDENRKALAGRAGSLISDQFSADNLSIIREVWISAGCEAIAIRQKVWNRSAKPVYLKALVPLYCEGKQSLVISNEQNAKNWDVLIQQRLKNGRPQTILPSESTEFEIDHFVLFHKRNQTKTPVLLIGFLSQMGHCARMWLQFDNNNGTTHLKHFMTECEFDGVLVPPGGERTSQWVFINMGINPNKLVADFADRVGVYHGIKEPPKDAPSVFCTWYFHGADYSEEYFHADLAALKSDHLPFDVFLIDESWSVNRWGDFVPIESWSSGMEDAADRIRSLGYKPGIWSCPYLVDFNSNLAKTHPEWLLKDAAGDRIIFFMNNIDHWVLDLTFPGVCDFLEESYRKLSADWGYEYFKFDFMRAVFLEKGQKFYDPKVTRLEAYRMGLEAIRRGTGPDAYISVCGGHYGGSLGLANSQRSGSDVVSIWRSKEIPKFRQNILRTWMSRLWHVDPDAMMVRKRENRFHPDKELSLGLLTNNEANTIALNQYIAGGLITFTEFMPELDAERKSLYRQVIPSINSSSVPLDIFDPLCPSILLTCVNPLCRDLDPWVTVSVINWTDENKEMSVQLSPEILESLYGNQVLVFEFFEQEVLGIFKIGGVINLGKVEPHTSRLLRIAPWDGLKPMLAGTDLHFSGGGVEMTSWKILDRRVEGQIDTQWRYPVKVTVAFPAENKAGFIWKFVIIEPGQQNFWIDFPG